MQLEQWEARYILEITGRGERDFLPGTLGEELGLRATMIQDATRAKHNLKDATEAEKWEAIEIDAVPFPISEVRALLNEEIDIVEEDGKIKKVKQNGSSSQFFTGPMLKMFDFES